MKLDVTVQEESQQSLEISILEPKYTSSAALCSGLWLNK